MPVKLEWQDGRFNFSEAKLPHGLTLAVCYEIGERLKPGAPTWNMWVFGRKLKGRAETMETAKERAERAAVIWLQECLGVMGEQCQAQPSPAP